MITNFPKNVENILKTVCYIGILNFESNSIVPIGTGFFLGRDLINGEPTFVVTAKHIINGAKSRGVENVYLRTNMTDGRLLNVKTTFDEWIEHQDPNVDVVILKLNVPDYMDHLLQKESELMSLDDFKDSIVSVCDDVIIAGLFTHHHGSNRNLPIIRTGTISALPYENIQTKHHLMEGFLIETRSIGGLSGSPVFHRKIIDIDRRDIEVAFSFRYKLIGIIYGHYDDKYSIKDEVEQDINHYEKINTGIAIITPSWKILELLNRLD